MDGTKLEANANKYKFVWKPEAKMRKLLRKAGETCARFGVHPGKTHSGYVGERSEPPRSWSAGWRNPAPTPLRSEEGEG